MHPHPLDYCCPSPGARGENLSDVPIRERPLSLLPWPPHHAPSGNPPVTRRVRGYGVREGFMWPAWLKSSPKVEVVLLLKLLNMEVTTKLAEEHVRCCGIVFPQELNRTWSKKQECGNAESI